MSAQVDETEFLPDSPPVALSVRGLSIEYHTDKGAFRAADNVTFDVPPGRTLGLVGESGCGKTTVAKAILRLLPENADVSGEVMLDGEDVLTMPQQRLRDARWTRMSFIAQSAMNCLDPVQRVGTQIAETIRAHEKVSKKQALHRAAQLLELVGIPSARAASYPHEFSGGMRQRVVIAMALSLNAGLIIADEPTTALDSIMQGRILGKIRELQRRLHRSMVIVTHDLGVVNKVCDDVAVMYAGVVVELGPARTILDQPAHPYTMGLSNAFPRVHGEMKPLISIAGELPDLHEPPVGCVFAGRCPFSTERCEQERPAPVEIAPGHQVACHYRAQAMQMREESADPQTWKAAEPVPVPAGSDA